MKIIKDVEFLHQKSLPVEIFSAEISGLAVRMWALMPVLGIGLSAIQVGQELRLFIARGPGKMFTTFCNPVITGFSRERCWMQEGCLSFPGVYRSILRPVGVSVDAQDAEGNWFPLRTKGLLARVIQHEMDHLDGITFLDRAEGMVMRGSI
jgi:peptide deformylase